MEVYELSGKTPSAIRQEHGFRNEEVPMTVIHLDWEKTLLRERIGYRIDLMLEMGWLHEVKRLLERGVSEDAVAMSSVGYRELVSYIKGTLPEDEVYRAIEKSTWWYAKRQRTWMKKEKSVRTIQIDDSVTFGDKVTEIVDQLKKTY